MMRAVLASMIAYSVACGAVLPMITIFGAFLSGETRQIAVALGFQSLARGWTLGSMLWLLALVPFLVVRSVLWAINGRAGVLFALGSVVAVCWVDAILAKPATWPPPYIFSLILAGVVTGLVYWFVEGLVRGETGKRHLFTNAAGPT